MRRNLPDGDKKPGDIWQPLKPQSWRHQQVESGVRKVREARARGVRDVHLPRDGYISARIKSGSSSESTHVVALMSVAPAKSLTNNDARQSE